MTDLEKYEPPSIDETTRWAEKYAGSGMFTDARQVEQAFVKISAGAELGLTPFQSMTGVHIIQGKPVVGAGLLASLLDRDPAYDYSVSWEPNVASPTACTVTVFKDGKERGPSRFSLDDAKRAGLLKGGGNWEKYPSAMLFARAMSQAVRWYAPGATGTSVYVEGEISAEPTARVEARVQRFNDAVTVPEELVEGELLDESASTTGAVHDPVGAGNGVAPDRAQTGATNPPLREQFTHLTSDEKAELYALCGLDKGTHMPTVKARLIAEADVLGLAYSEEPDAAGILAAARRLADASQGELDEEGVL